jgi:hypothetical protein
MIHSKDEKIFRPNSLWRVLQKFSFTPLPFWNIIGSVIHVAGAFLRQNTPREQRKSRCIYGYFHYHFDSFGGKEEMIFIVSCPFLYLYAVITCLKRAQGTDKQMCTRVQNFQSYLRSLS